MGSRCPSLPGGCTVALWPGVSFRKWMCRTWEGWGCPHRQDITLLPLPDHVSHSRPGHCSASCQGKRPAGRPPATTSKLRMTESSELCRSLSPHRPFDSGTRGLRHLKVKMEPVLFGFVGGRGQ